jgi:tight adherence protein C
MIVIISFALCFSSIGIIVYQFSSKAVLEGVSLPFEIKGEVEQKKFTPKEILNFAARFTDRFSKKTGVSFAEKVKRKLISAGRPMNFSQFMALKFIVMLALPIGAYILFKPQTPVLIIALAIGFYLPDMMIKSKIQKRRREVLKDLPYIIDLLNICVGAGLDFMVAVSHVIHEFRVCVMVEELKTVMKEIQMGLSRREALKNLAQRVGSPEVNSFVRTLLQADRMGTPITTALKMHSEELRDVRFQRGEEMALKAPIKLLFPLLAFILPVVMIIVAGPILIQFTKGGLMKF